MTLKDEQTAQPHGSLARILSPASVAVVGASRDSTKRGYQVVRALQAGGFPGAIHPVNPAGGEILGLRVTPSIESLPWGVDLAVLCTPAATAPDLVAACGRAGIAGAVVLALGFRELGAEGARLEETLAATARGAGVRLIGPNTSGMLNLPSGLDIIGVGGVATGPLALLTQSGNITLDLLRESSASRGPGFSVCVGVGNETDIAFHEYIHHLGDDGHTRAILVHAEGIRDGRMFLEVVGRVSRQKPVVFLKGGRSREGLESALSHTGSVSTSHDVFRTALRQFGVIEVDRSDELLPVGGTLALQRHIPRGSGVGVLSDGGGQATLVADILSSARISVPALAGPTTSRLRELLPPPSAIRNPLDVAGACDRNPELFPTLLHSLLADPAVGGGLVVGLFGGYALRFSPELAGAEMEAARSIVEVVRGSGKPVVIHSMYADAVSPPLDLLRDAGIPVIRSLDVACRAIRALAERGDYLGRAGEGSLFSGGWTAVEGAGEPVGAIVPPPAPAAPRAPGEDPVATARLEGRTLLLEPEVRELLARRGAEVVKGWHCRSPEDAARAARQARGPLCLKIISPDIVHKSDVGGVVLGVAGAERAASAYRSLIRRVAREARLRGTTFRIQGVLATRLLPSPGMELLVGARRDPVFGPVLTVGAGGGNVEILRDVSLRVLPLEPGEGRLMLEELRLAPLLYGYRGRAPLDVEATLAIMDALSRCIMEIPELQEIEVNPVFVLERGAVAVDARAFLTPAPSAGHHELPGAIPAQAAAATG
jgi:acetate---CoA ligase (ADP-forming)